MSSNGKLLSVRNLSTHFFTEESVVKAVQGVSFSIKKGRTFALVGESGCGKSVTALSIMRLVPAPQGKIVGGEIVFDGLLVEQLQQCGHVVTLVVRGDQILNDVTMESAVDAGVDDLCTIISNGTSCPGTPIGESSGELQKAFSSADLIISKGQGNFETLSGVDAPIYFLLTVKCSVVAQHITSLNNITVDKITGSGEFVLMKTSKSSAALHLHTVRTCGIEKL